jgi:hypothetical protein
MPCVASTLTIPVDRINGLPAGLWESGFTDAIRKLSDKSSELIIVFVCLEIG